MDGLDNSLPPSYTTSPLHPGVKCTQPETGIGVLSLIDINIKRQDGRNFIDSPPEMERQTVEQEEIPPTGP